MHLVVCVKQVLDPEMSSRDFAIDPARKRPVEGKAPLVISTFDEIAVEIALRLREAAGGGTITALSLGPASADEVLRRAMAMQADAAVRIEAAGFPEADAVTTAAALAAAIRTLGAVDAVLCGREAADTDAGQVGPILAELLGMPVVANAILAWPGPDGALHVRRESEDGIEVVAVRPPVVITATNSDANVPRIPKVKDVMAAHRKPIRVLRREELAVDPALVGGGNWVSLEDLYLPPAGGQCRLVAGESVEEKVDALVRELLEMKVI